MPQLRNRSLEADSFAHLILPVPNCWLPIPVPPFSKTLVREYVIYQSHFQIFLQAVTVGILSNHFVKSLLYIASTY